MNRSGHMTDGARAEQLAADYLMHRGFKILERNYRTRWSEIDIVVEKAGTIRFIEVKYRKNSIYGSGYDYITPDKQRRLVRAAEMYMVTRAQDWQIDIISITDNKLEYLENAVNG